jgi:heme/copper-type cytochrome/quinol oxidase subunit 2
MGFAVFLIFVVVAVMVLFLGTMFAISEETDQEELRFGMTRNQLRLTAWGIAIVICLVGAAIEFYALN